MKGGYLGLLLFFSLSTQEHESRQMGGVVSDCDRLVWKKIKKHHDIHEDELIAAYSDHYKEWLYAQVILAPRNNFSGLARFEKDGSPRNNFAINFKSYARKLATDEELNEAKQKNFRIICAVQ